MNVEIILVTNYGNIDYDYTKTFAGDNTEINIKKHLIKLYTFYGYVFPLTVDNSIEEFVTWIAETDKASLSVNWIEDTVEF